MATRKKQKKHVKTIIVHILRAHNHVCNGLLVLGQHTGVIGFIIGIVRIHYIDGLRIVKLSQSVESAAHIHFAHHG